MALAGGLTSTSSCIFKKGCYRGDSKNNEANVLQMAKKSYISNDTPLGHSRFLKWSQSVKFGSENNIAWPHMQRSSGPQFAPYTFFSLKFNREYAFHSLIYIRFSSGFSWPELYNIGINWGSASLVYNLCFIIPNRTHKLSN